MLPHKTRRIPAGVICALALMTIALPKAQAQGPTSQSFRAGQILAEQIFRGDPAIVQQMVGPFVGAIHSLVTDNSVGGQYWAITRDDSQIPLAVCPYVRQDPRTGILQFAGPVNAGLPQLYNAQIAGQVGRDQLGQLIVVIRLQSPLVDVGFVQPLQPYP
jgi:hypothetical protein